MGCRVLICQFLGTGYCVSTVALDEEAIKKYIRDQNKSDNYLRL